MLKREPKRGSFGSNPFVTGLKAFIAFELVLVGGSYILWRKLNYSQDFRYKMYNKYPSILNAYYWMGERGGYNAREYDYKTWGIKE